MKRDLYFCLVVLVAVVLGCSLTASAQGIADVWQVPFAFSVSNVTLPAGQYIVQSGALISKLATREGDKVVYFMPFVGSPDLKKAKATLVFSTYGHEVFLAKIYTAQGTNCLQLQKSRREREVAAQVKVASGQSRRTIEIASNR
jgi:hypothetical protein